MRIKFLGIKAFILFFFIGFSAFSQETLERIKINKAISLKVPESFIPMAQAEINSKYVSYRQPIAMFTNDNRDVDLGINRASTSWQGNDMTILREFYKASIQNLFSEVNFLTDEIREIGGKEFILFEFVSRVSGEDNTFGTVNSAVSKYTYIAYTLYNDYVLLFNFTCDSKLRPYWQESATEIIESIRIN